MALRGMIFDIDGTLVDTNPAHVEAWRRAFQRFGFEVPTERIELEIGKGGDKLVPSILGEDVEGSCGEALRRAQKEEFLEIAEREHFRVFPCVPSSSMPCSERGIRTALATSSDEKHLAGHHGQRRHRPAQPGRRAGHQERRRGQQACARSGYRRRGEAGRFPDRLRHGGRHGLRRQACQAAGVVFLGVLSGGTTEAELLQAGRVRRSGATPATSTPTWIERSRSPPSPRPPANSTSNLSPRSSRPMTTSEETDWMNHPAIRALVDQANTLALEERITLVKGLIPAIANALSEDEYEQFVTFVRLKGERYLEAKSHPGTGRAERHTPGERELEGR